MEENKHYTPRLIGSFLLSSIIGWGLNILVSLVLVSTLVLVPMLLNSIFDFSFGDALHYASIPVVGRFMAIYDGDDFPIRLTILIVFFIVVIAPCLILCALDGNCSFVALFFSILILWYWLSPWCLLSSPYCLLLPFRAKCVLSPRV